MTLSPQRDWTKYTDEEWKQILSDLIKYAKIKCAVLPIYMEPEDIAYEALRRILDNTRQWNKDKYPNILQLLRGAVDSIFYSHYHSPKVKFLKAEIHENSTESSIEKYGNSISNEESFNQYCERRLNQLNTIVSGDCELEELVLAMECGYIDYDDIARELQWDKKKLYNAIKRLKRRIEEAKTGAIDEPKET
jgi:hypothetical protein